MATQDQTTATPRSGTVALLLPGMTLNRTIFPELSMRTLALDFCDRPPPLPRSLANLYTRDAGRQRDVTDRLPDLDDYVAALESFLAAHGDRWDAERRIVVAHSFGAMLALRWLITRAATEAAKIHGLVLIAASAGPLFDRVGVRLGNVFGRELRVPFAPFYPLWNTPVVTRAMKRVTSRGRLDAEPQDFSTLARPSDLALDLTGWRNTDWQAMRAFRHALRGFDVRSELHRVHVPAIVLHGTCDALFAVREAEALVAGLPHAELRVIAGAGHGLPLTHGPEVAQAAAELVRGGRRHA